MDRAPRDQLFALVASAQSAKIRSPDSFERPELRLSISLFYLQSYF